MYNIHVEGGMIFMMPLTLLLLINLGIITFVSISASKKKQADPIWLEMIRQIGGLAFIWGMFSTLIGLYFAFRDLSTMKETLPLAVIMGGLKVAMITLVYGSIILAVSLSAYIGLKILHRKF
jgi:uncharacterized membrane protein